MTTFPFSLIHPRSASNTQPSAEPFQAEAGRLQEHLRKTIEGEVRFDTGSRALYATDASNYRQVPIGVVIPKHVDDIVNTVAACHHEGVPILSRGGGTSLAGQCCNVAVVMDMSKYVNAIVDIDPSRRVARVQPGLILDVLRHAAEKHQLTFAPDPSTHDHCTLGGMIGNNSCGVHGLLGGKTMDNIEEMDILTYDGLRMRVGKTTEDELENRIKAGGRQGDIYARLKSIRDRYGDQIRNRFPAIPRRISGYNLPQLLPENDFHVARALVGTEATCVTVLEATVSLVQSPPKRSLVVLGYPDVFTAGDHLPEILSHHPIGLEGLDDILIENIKKKQLRVKDLPLLPDGGGWLLVEFGGETQQEADDQARNLIDDLKKQSTPPNMEFIQDSSQAKRVWEIREAGLGATAHVPGEEDTWEGWEDSAVAPEHVGAYLRDFQALSQKYEYRCALYGHFGEGCIHTRINFDLKTKGGIKKFRNFIEESADLIMKYNGSLSGEHGEGQARGELLPKMYGQEIMNAFREFKLAWDPDWKMNPGKVIDADPLDHHLRLGTSYNPPQPDTHFQFLNDQGSFPRVTARCVGIGNCRRMYGGTMCPSYRATQEEMHSTRGRAHLLFEMLQEGPLTNGWRNEHVKEALDLCLACKGCLSECPVNVDMATYKAEFLAHYYKGRLRSRAAYSMGLIYWWSRIASLMPGVVNAVTHTPMLGTWLKKLGGIAPQRDMPRYAPQSFTSWFHERPSRPQTGTPVMLWPDTFNNFFYPHTLKAAVEVLEHVGCSVKIPSRPLCCGRPLYDFGMLPTAKTMLRQLLQALEQDLAKGIPLIGLEPSCVAVFRDELGNLFPNDEQAARLQKQAYTLGEFLDQEKGDFDWPQLPRRAIVHGHCHQKAVMGMSSEMSLLDKIGLEYHMLDSGCCGMSGSFGFKQEHYDISLKIGEHILLPKVREASPDTFVISDGFSCREQISQATGRQGMHVAEVIQRAINSGP